MASTTNFYFFQVLPSEIRLQIWQLAQTSTRTIIVTCDTGRHQRGITRTAKSFNSSTSPPALTHVCRESRFEALRVYEPAFQTSTSPQYIYVNFIQDTIRACGNMLQFLNPQELHRIRKMVLHDKDPAYFGHFMIDVLKSMQPNLEELELGASLI